MESIKRRNLKRKWSQEYKNEDKENEDFDFSEYDQEPQQVLIKFCNKYITKKEFERTGLIETEKAINVCFIFQF